MVVSQRYNARPNIFDNTQEVLSWISQSGIIDAFKGSYCRQPHFFIFVGKAPFDSTDIFVPRNDDEQFISMVCRLSQK